MKVLAIETSTMAGGIAIVDDNEGLIGEVRINTKIAHAERLMNSIIWLLNASCLSIKEIDAFAISIGPGSFTGLRIGLSSAKGFSYATNKPLVPVPTLDAFARTVPFCTHFICPMLDARKNQVYTGLYKWEGNLCKKIIPETAVEPRHFLKDVKEYFTIEEIQCLTVFIGEGAKIYEKLITEILKTNAIFASFSKICPSALSVAEIAIEKLRAGIITNPVTLTPFYIRKSEAEIHWKE